MCDALVIGAGPAGAAAAWALARDGHRVVLLDRLAFPRDKTCGDGLIADAQQALDAMGLREAVEREAFAAREMRVHAPNGRAVSLSGSFRCLPRQRFDAMLVEQAVAAGAELRAPVTALQSVERDGRVAGARVRSAVGEQTIEARVTLLATGANATTAAAFGLPLPPKPNAVAGRAYYEAPASFAECHPHLSIVYDRALLPGYGWIFPGPDRCYNAGVGVFAYGGRERPGVRELWDRFTTGFPAAAELVAVSRLLAPFRGAPLRDGLQHATLGRPGMVVLGDAAAMTYPATGEGIGKAMQSGLLAAELIGAALGGRAGRDDVHAVYDREFRRRFTARYRAYWTAQAWTSRPWLLNLLAWRANSGSFVRGEFEALIAEEGDPGRLFSPAGMIRAAIS